MSITRSVQSRFVGKPAVKSERAIERAGQLGKAPAWRRAAANLIDRMLPLPFIAFFFPQWSIAVFLYHLLCDSSPERRSCGKWVCRLRVVPVEIGEDCELTQSLLRRIGSAASQTAWCLWEWLPFVLVYEAISIILVLLHPQGRRLEDLLAGTRVITERAYRSLKQ